ncbi:MAG: ribosome small subunit-dependent GTPase A [Cytophagales bacterium]|nr:ribosome small subunit-dependent GTPase A [Cytophagales bacterium]
MKEGLVLKSTGSWYSILGMDGQEYIGRVRGKLRLKGVKTTNPIAVGDRVNISVEDGQESRVIIEEIIPRDNYIIRQSVKKTEHAHMLAANIDQALLVVTLTYPKTSLGFIDRFLVTAESFRIPQVLVFNKQDLLDAEERQQQQVVIEIYENIGIPCLETSAVSGGGVESFEQALQDKKTLISGHSGVGKSTLVNLVMPGVNQKTSEVSDFAEKGVHTTTFAEMFQLNPGTFLIDTPGIKELGLAEIEGYELSDYFPEMRVLRNECKFNNCLHTNEPHCAIKNALAAGEIAESRYKSYLSMLAAHDNRR